MLRVFMVILAIIFGIGALLGPIERAMLYPFDATRVSPEKAGVTQLKETRLIVKTDTKEETLILWVAPPKSGKPVILYFHGNAGNLANRAGRFRHFLAQGYGVIAPAYRGSSGSSGTPSQAALRADALAIYRQIASLIGGKSTPVVLYGESLGTGVVIALNGALKGNDQKPGALILEAPFTSIPEVVLATYPVLEPLVGRIQNRWDSGQKAGKITAPLLVFHGDKDALIPQKHGREIYAKAKSRDKNFVSVKGAGHTTIWRSDTLPVMWKFIKRYAVK